MKPIQKFMATAIMFATCSCVMAAGNGPVYADLGVTQIDITSDGVDSPHYKPVLVRATMGAEINSYLAIEGMAAMTMNKSTEYSAGVETTATVNSAGIYLRPKFSIAKQTEVFGRVGLAKTKINYTSLVGDSSASFSGGSYGAGVRVLLTPAVYLQADYMTLYRKDGTVGNGWGLSYGVRF